MTITYLISRSSTPETIANLIEQFFDTQCIEQFPTQLPVVCESMARGQIPADPSLQTKAAVENFMKEVLRAVAHLERLKLPHPQPTDSVGASRSLLLSPSLLFSPAKQPTPVRTDNGKRPPSNSSSNDLSGGTQSDEESDHELSVSVPKRKLYEQQTGSGSSTLFRSHSDDDDEQTNQEIKRVKTETNSLSS